jgi:polyisoprenoid-binding protein YceI
VITAKNILLLLLSANFFSGQPLFTLSNYKIENTKQSDMKLSGTSTLHDWTMRTPTFTSEAQFDFTTSNDHQLTALKSLTFSLAVRNLKSDSKAMDKNAYKALKADQHTDITYQLISAAVTDSKEKSYLIKTQGNLQVAGVTKEVSIDVHCVVNKDASITCIGSSKLKMTDYQVKPPSFLLGAMKTGDALTLDFKLVYKKQESN